MSDDLLESEFKQPYLDWQQNPNPQTSSTLLKKVNPVLTAAIRTYGIPGSPTLHSRAKIMALDAMKRYDPSKAKLRTHLMFQLQGLRRHAAKEQQILSVPEQVALDLGHVRESENYLRDQLGRDPSDDELSEHTMLSSKRLNYIRKMQKSYPEGQFQRSTDEGEDFFAPAVGNKNERSGVIELLYHDLSPIDQVILEHTLGYKGKKVLPNQEVARKLNISPGAVSQRKARIQAKLDEFTEINPFA